MKKSLRPLFSVTILTFAIVFYLNLSGSVSFSQEIEQNQSAVSSDKEDNSRSGDISSDSGDQGTPTIYFPKKEHDFGTVSQGSKVTHKFKVQNTGDAPLKLIKAKGS